MLQNIELFLKKYILMFEKFVKNMKKYIFKNIYKNKIFLYYI